MQDMEQGEPRPFVFTATGEAYFRIWIVNLLLTIVTVGIYSPWAKVRRLRFFYGNTLFDGSPFEFHGSPLALFKGRLIGGLLLIAYTQAAKVSLTLWAIVIVALLALMPWLLWKSFRFRLANSSYRGIHFAFDGTLGQAYLVFVPLMLMVLGPALTPLLLVTIKEAGASEPRTFFIVYAVVVGIALLLSPWFYFRLRAYQHRNARIGATPFMFDGRLNSAYAIGGKAFVLGAFFLLVGLFGGAIAGGLTWIATKQLGPISALRIAGYAGIPVFYLIMISGWSFTKAMVQNFVWNHSILADARFVSNVGRSHLWGIEALNLLLTLITLGFFWPFAVVRSMRYRIESLGWGGASDALVAVSYDAKVGATGEETAELFGLDIAL
jgi:uncharacterized membrane protein YjgN (DUF898 family)